MELISPKDKIKIRKEKGYTLTDVVLERAIDSSEASRISHYCNDPSLKRKVYLVQTGPKVRIVEYQGKKIPASNVFDCDSPSSIVGLGNSYYGYEYILKIKGEDGEVEKNIREIYDMLPTKK